MDELQEPHSVESQIKELTDQVASLRKVVAQLRQELHNYLQVEARRWSSSHDHVPYHDYER